VINASHILMLSLPLTLPVFGRTAPAGAPPILETKVFGFDEANGLLALDVGSDNGVGIDDPFWIFADKDIVAEGVIYLVTDRRSVGRLSRRPTATVTAGQTVNPDPASFQLLKQRLDCLF